MHPDEVSFNSVVEACEKARRECDNVLSAFSVLFGSVRGCAVDGRSGTALDYGAGRGASFNFELS